MFTQRGRANSNPILWHADSSEVKSDVAAENILRNQNKFEEDRVDQIVESVETFALMFGTVSETGAVITPAANLWQEPEKIKINTEEKITDKEKRQAIYCFWKQLAELFVSSAMRKDNISIFTNSKIPSVSILDYYLRIEKYISESGQFLSPTDGMSIINLMIGFLKRNPNIQLDAYNVHRILIVTASIYMKFSGDYFYMNNFYAKVGGIPLSNLNMLEVEFIALTQGDLLTLMSPQNYQRTEAYIIESKRKYEAKLAQEAKEEAAKKAAHPVSHLSINVELTPDQHTPRFFHRTPRQQINNFDFSVLVPGACCTIL